MAATASTMLELGTRCPAFDLPDYGAGKDGSTRVTRDDFESAPATVVMFICNHCPFVHHVQEGIVELARAFPRVGFLAISSNDVETHPDDAPEMMAREASRLGYPFPYLYDETQGVAKAFRAACTPDFFVFDGELRLVYRGQFDDSRPAKGSSSAASAKGEDLRAAIGAALRGERSPDQKPSLGCNIKWKPGNAPDYFG